jgi:flagellar motor switch protein FliN
MSEDLRQSLATELATDLARAIEAMTSELPKLGLESDAAPAVAQSTTWKQPFNETSGAAWLNAPTATWISLGARTLRAAGIEDGDDDTSKSTFVEIISQAFSMLARSLSGRTKKEWTCTEGGESTETADASAWTSVHLEFADGTTDSLGVAFDQAMIRDLIGAPPAAVATVAKTAGPVAYQLSLGNSKTLELLLDVELPVSVSFGRAQLPLKDVIKLTTGSIVELNRAITEPVEVIVNNCVIARGEVVVVEGNYGVRVQQVVSKEERLRTLY